MAFVLPGGAVIVAAVDEKADVAQNTPNMTNDTTPPTPDAPKATQDTPEASQTSATSEQAGLEASGATQAPEQAAPDKPKVLYCRSCGQQPMFVDAPPRTCDYCGAVNPWRTEPPRITVDDLRALNDKLAREDDKKRQTKKPKQKPK